MALYEHIFLARQDISTQQVDGLVEKFKQVLTDNGGTTGKVENWGLRTSTYRIKKNRKAHYILMNVDAPAAAVSGTGDAAPRRHLISAAARHRRRRN